MEIALLHKHYSNEHLNEVIAEMQMIGSPKIRAIWSEMFGIWMAVEGCHRLRAAQQLGLTPEIIDISADENATIQLDECDEIINVIDLLVEMQDDALNLYTIQF